MMSNREIRQFAWRQLKGNWGAAIGASLLSTVCLMGLVVLMAGGYMLAFLGGALAIYRTTAAADYRFVLPVVGIIMAALLFLLIYLAAGFSLGALRLNLRIARGEKVRAASIFAGFTDFLQLRHFICVYILLNLSSLALNIPVSIVSAIYGSDSGNAHIVSLVCNTLAVVYALFMSMAALAAAEDRNRSAIRSVQVSWHLMRCRKLRLVGLFLSFAPWLLLSMASFGIGYLVTIPYISVAQAIFFLSAYSEDYLATVQEMDFREVPEDNVGGADAGAGAVEEAAPETLTRENVSNITESGESIQMETKQDSDLGTIASANADRTSTENTDSARRSFEEVYREVVLNGRNAETENSEKGEEL